MSKNLLKHQNNYKDRKEKILFKAIQLLMRTWMLKKSINKIIDQNLPVNTIIGSD